MRDQFKWRQILSFRDQNVLHVFFDISTILADIINEIFSAFNLYYFLQETSKKCA